MSLILSLLEYTVTESLDDSNYLEEKTAAIFTGFYPILKDVKIVLLLADLELLGAVDFSLY